MGSIFMKVRFRQNSILSLSTPQDPSVWIGLFNRGGTWEWLGSSTPVVYDNFRGTQPDSTGDCVEMMVKWNGFWNDRECAAGGKRYACSKAAEECESKEMMEYALQKRTCIGQNTTSDTLREGGTGKKPRPLPPHPHCTGHPPSGRPTSR